MYYIYLDESDKKGDFYSNFYGGILIPSRHRNHVVRRLTAAAESVGIKEEIKWQKVNAYTFERYKTVIDELFAILAEGKAKIRIVFTHNKFRVPLTQQQAENTYTILYYLFVKKGFGFEYAPPSQRNRLALIFDQLPIGLREKAQFRQYLCSLNANPEFQKAGISISNESIQEADSKRFIALQCLDLVLGAICFRLNDKHKIKDPETGKVGKRTRLKLELYKYILGKIRNVTGKQHFNIGVSTGIKEISDYWTSPYRHWSFKPNNSEEDNSLSKHHNK